MDNFDEYTRLSLCFKALGSGLWDYEIDTDRLECDNAWYRILGLDGSLSSIKSIEDFKPFIHVDDVERATAVDLEEVDEIIKTDGRYYNEFRIIRSSGEVRLIRSVACVVVDVVTGHKRAVGCITDLTAPNKLEQASARWPMRLAPDNPQDHDQDEDSAETMESAALSDKERECLLWVSQGKTAAETAQIMGRSRRTIEFHINNAVRKLGSANKIHAAVTAIRMGIL